MDVDSQSPQDSAGSSVRSTSKYLEILSALEKMKPTVRFTPLLILAPPNKEIDLSNIGENTDVGTAQFDFGVICELALNRRCIFIIGPPERVRKLLKSMGAGGMSLPSNMYRGLYFFKFGGVSFIWSLDGCCTNFDITARIIALRLASFAVVLGYPVAELSMADAFWRDSYGRFPPYTYPADLNWPYESIVDEINSPVDREADVDPHSILQSLEAFAEDEFYVELEEFRKQGLSEETRFE